MEAWYHGQFPTAWIHPSSCTRLPGHYPAVISVNHPKSSSWNRIGAAGLYSISLAVNVNATNDLSKYGYSQTEFKEYGSVLLEIPDIPPGKSTTMYMPLEPCSITDQNGGTCGQFEDYEGMKPIYFNGVTKMKVFEACYSTGSSWEWVPCTDGGQDYWEFDNPSLIDLFDP